MWFWVNNGTAMSLVSWSFNQFGFLENFCNFPTNFCQFPGRYTDQFWSTLRLSLTISRPINNHFKVTLTIFRPIFVIFRTISDNFPTIFSRLLAFLTFSWLFFAFSGPNLDVYEILRVLTGTWTQTCQFLARILGCQVMSRT